MAINNIEGMNKSFAGINADDWLKQVGNGNNNDGIAAPKIDVGELDSTYKTSSNMSFSEMLTQSLKDVNNLQMEANKAMEKLATGQTKDIHETMLAAEHAELAFKTMNQVRMKVLDAYKEIMRMQI